MKILDELVGKRVSVSLLDLCPGSIHGRHEFTGTLKEVDGHLISVTLGEDEHLILNTMSAAFEDIRIE